MEDLSSRKRLRKIHDYRCPARETTLMANNPTDSRLPKDSTALLSFVVSQDRLARAKLPLTQAHTVGFRALPSR